jgi:hypothetical protein
MIERGLRGEMVSSQERLEFEGDVISGWTLLLTRPYCVVERVRLASAPDFV